MHAQKSFKYPLPSKQPAPAAAHWNVQPTQQGNTVVEESSFSVKFPSYREEYLRQWWPHIARALNKHVRMP